MLENIRLSFRGIFAHKMRSFLTMLGVIIGIASIIAIVSTIAGSRKALMESMIGAGNNAVTITLKQGEYEVDQGYQEAVGVSLLSDDQKEAIRDIPHAEAATFFYMRKGSDKTIYSNEDTSLMSPTIYGVDEDYFTANGYVVKEGRGFVEEDFEERRKVIILNAQAARTLFPNGGSVGASVEIGDEVFTVIGTYRTADNFVATYDSVSDYYLNSGSEASVCLIPDTAWPVLFKFDEVENCTVKADSTDNMTSVGNAALTILRQSVKSTGSSESESSGEAAMNYQLDDVLTKAKNKAALNDSMNILLLCVAGIALLVGGIGVMNIMLVSVTERTSEIGLKKAIGARKSTILAQFLTESAVLTSIGGILGVIAGLIFAKILSVMTGTAVAVSVPAIILSVAFSMVIGIVFGLLPSMKAASLDPIDALRRE